MTERPVTRAELELVIQSFEQMGGMAKYAQILSDAMKAMRENFESIESALRMTQTLHNKQLQGIDHWISMCKFLIPLFAAIATAGLTIDTPTFRGDIATVVGSIGFLVFFAGLFEQSKKRQMLLDKQEKDVEKLHETFQQGQEMVNILKTQAQDERGEMTDDKMREQLEKALVIMKRSER